MIKPLTSFRFLAALAVFGSHLFILQNYEKTEWLFNRILYEGYIGVTFFFILSGFILTYTYHEKFKKINKESLLNFLQARVSRIYPVYILTFLLAIPLVFSTYSLEPLKSLIMTVFNLTMMQSFVPNSSFYFAFNSPSWSISNEMFFYCLFPFLLYGLIKLGISKSNKKVLILVSFAIVTYILAILIVWILRDASIAHWLFYIFPVFRLVDFFVGITIGICFIKIKDIKLNSKVFSTLEILSILLLITAFYFFPQVHQTLRFWGYYLPFMSLIVFIFAFQKGIISKFVSHRFIIYLGEISFSFYMIHQLVIRYLEHIDYVNNRPILFVFMAFSISLLLSHFIYKYYEIPLKNKLKSKKYRTKNSSKTVTQ